MDPIENADIPASYVSSQEGTWMSQEVRIKG